MLQFRDHYFISLKAGLREKAIYVKINAILLNSRSVTNQAICGLHSIPFCLCKFLYSIILSNDSLIAYLLPSLFAYNSNYINKIILAESLRE